MKDTVNTLMIAVGVSFEFIAVAWLAMIAMLSSAGRGGII